jgi:NAD(P)-dependent dehydrogenase (short-subunit alcohol dehydrogenase family)
MKQTSPSGSSLDNQVVVITGGSSGIGFDAARRFLELGARLVLSASQSGKLDSAVKALNGGERVASVVGDVAAPETARRIAAEAKQRFGRVDVLVNSAGVFGVKPFLETTDDDLERYLSVNLKGTFQVTRAIVPLMIEGGGGAIINLGTVLVGQAKVDLPVAAPMASKGGIHALTVALAAEFARHHIRVNTLAPGIIRTPLIGEAANSMAAWHPLGRVGEVGETSDAIVYLAQAGFVTGQILAVDGGYSSGR